MATNFEIPVTGGADPRMAADGVELGAIEGGKFGQRRRRIGLAVEVRYVIGQIAQLTRFIDQAGLFFANFPVTNELHVSQTPFWIFCCLDGSWITAG